MAIKRIPCGGFYVNDDAVEMRDGKPVLKTSGSDEVLDNAKQTGGIGWTEHIEETIIEWDGDIEGREILMPDMPCYKVSDKGVSTSLLIGATIVYDGHETVVTQDMLIELLDGVVAVGDAYIVSVMDNVEIDGITVNKGLYFRKKESGYTSTLIYGGEGIHKIKLKYMPSTLVEVSSNNTYDEVLEILNSGFMPYMQLDTNYDYARLYVSSVGRNKVDFGSPATLIDSQTRSYCTSVSANGWKDIINTESVHISNNPHVDGTYVLTCTVIDGETTYTWESAT